MKKLRHGINDLETWARKNGREDLLSEWNSAKNELMPKDFTYGSNKKVWWQCKEGHTWESRICNRTGRNNRCPYCSGNLIDVDKRVGETRLMNCGQKATVLVYRKSNDIDIKFEDGTIRERVSYAHFRDGKVLPVGNKNLASIRIGEVYKQKNGSICRIVEYKDSHHITIEYEDGEKRDNKKYRDILLGQCPQRLNLRTEESKEKLKKKFEKTRLGSEIKNKNGQMMKIIEYNGVHNISVQFEDGTIAKNQRMDQFKERRIINPNCRVTAKVSRNEFVLIYYLEKYGFKHAEINSVGEIDCYNEAFKIGIEYDGYVHRFHRDNDLSKNKKAIENGIKLIRIRDNLPPLNDSSYDININANGRPLTDEYENAIHTLIKYLNKLGLNIDDVVDFKHDSEDIFHQYSKRYLNARLYETKKMNCGLIAKIIAYRTYKDVDVEFENGTIKQHTSYRYFNTGVLTPYGRGKCKVSRDAS